ncbi:MAG: sodium ion-translocating decarboxylase subunit beta [Ruminococcaceae bacterium]|nr:sodium ion-translocating decarboxylase subunit beta [Oscillospiraceae bacterium]
MKKLFLTALFAVALFLSGCYGESSSVGIIGGADGPTAILVSSNFPRILPIIIICAIAIITVVVLIIHNFNKRG